MDLQLQLIKKIQWITDNQKFYLKWVPLVAFAVGGLVVVLNHQLKKKTKSAIKENCSICYNNFRTVIVEPCNHLVLCEGCARMVEVCPFCRLPIERKVLIQEYINE